MKKGGRLATPDEMKAIMYRHSEKFSLTVQEWTAVGDINNKNYWKTGDFDYSVSDDYVATYGQLAADHPGDSNARHVVVVYDSICQWTVEPKQYTLISAFTDCGQE